MRTIGSSTDGFIKVPTLRAALRAGLDIPMLNLVDLIFKPGKFPAISLQCEDKFRVNIREDSDLYRDVLLLFDELENEETALFVEVPSGSEGEFVVVVDEQSRSEWKEFDWGFRLEKHRKVASNAGKKPRASTRKEVQ